MRAVLLVLAVALAVVAWRHDDDAPFASSWVAAARVPEVAVYSAPDAPEPTTRLANPLASGTALVFLVDRVGADGVEVLDDDWLPVHLPVRPNGSKGWIRAEDVVVTRNDYRITIDLDDRTLAFHERNELQWTTPIGLGRPGTPTPRGAFYVKELLQSPDPDGLYGPFAFGLSGYTDSPGAIDFNGGDGVLGIHGTNDPASIGKTVSHGCIRVSNDVITHLASILPMGTPVDIV